MEETSPFMSIQDAATYLGVDYKTVYRLVQAGKLRAGKVGGMYRIRKQDLEDYLDVQADRMGDRSREAKAPSAAEKLACGRCYRLLGPGREHAGICAAEGCPQRICRACWDAGHRECADHQPSDQQRLALAQAALSRGEIAVLVTAVAARQAERAWITRFDERIQGIGSLYHPGTREVLRIADWGPFHQEEDETLQLMQLLNVGFLDRVAQATLPHNERSSFRIAAGKLGWGRPGQALLIEARCVARLGAYVQDGFDTRPLGLEELLVSLAEVEAAVAEARATGIVGLASPTGWDENAIRQMIDEGGRAYRHPDLLPFLVDLGSGNVYHDGADGRGGGFSFADLFKLPLDAEEALVVRNQIDALMAGREGQPVQELVKTLRRPEKLVQRVCEELAATGRYKLVRDSDLGLALLRNRE